MAEQQKQSALWVAVSVSAVILVAAIIWATMKMQPAEQPWVILSQIGAIYYFAHFLVILPIVSRIERPLPMPNSITEAVLAKHAPDTVSVPAAA